MYSGVRNQASGRFAGFSAASGPSPTAFGPFPTAFGPFSVAFRPFRSLSDRVGPVPDSSGAFWSDFGHSRAISETSLAGGRIIASEA